MGRPAHNTLQGVCKLDVRHARKKRLAADPSHHLDGHSQTCAVQRPLVEWNPVALEVDGLEPNIPIHVQAKGLYGGIPRSSDDQSHSPVEALVCTRNFVSTDVCTYATEHTDRQKAFALGGYASRYQRVQTLLRSKRAANGPMQGQNDVRRTGQSPKAHV
jgi:hypothetical protein